MSLKNIFKSSRINTVSNPSNSQSSHNQGINIVPPPVENNDEKQSEKWWLGFLVILLLLAYGMGTKHSKNDQNADNDLINRQAKVTLWTKRSATGMIVQVTSQDLIIIAESQKKRIPLNTVHKVEFSENLVEEEARPVQKNITHKLSSNEERFLGKYRANVTDHISTLKIYQNRSGRLGASLQFHNWGNGLEEILYHVRVYDNKIQFKRVCYGKRCLEIGSHREIRQLYVGTLSQDNQRIVGTYKGGQNGSEWSAIRIP